MQEEKNELVYVKCNICNQDGGELLFDNIDRLHGYPGVFRIVKCKLCGLVYLNPRPKNISSYYPDDYVPYNVNKEDFFQKIANNLMDAYYNESLNVIVRFKAFLYRMIYNPVPKERKGRILDIGCGNGIFLYNLKKYGWDVFGLDMSRKAVEFAQKQLGLDNVQNVFLEDMNYSEESFDVITLNHVIEHLPDPKNTLVKLNKILKKGGLLIIATPNSKSLNFRLFGRNWFPLETPRHLNLFDYSTIKKILNDTGFLLDKSAYGISTDQLMRSVNYLAKIELIKRSRLVFLPLMICLSFFGKSDIATFYAAKSGD